ncbi:hypothetical protein KCU78_g92, partial [Aureobasidium melanogenum]
MRLSTENSSRVMSEILDACFQGLDGKILGIPKHGPNPRKSEARSTREKVQGELHFEPARHQFDEKFDHLSPGCAPGSSRFISYKNHPAYPVQRGSLYCPETHQTPGAPSAATTQLWFSLQSAPALLKFWKLRDMSFEKREAIFSKSHQDHARLSRLVPYSSLILTVSCVVIFLARIYILEPLIKRYNKQYKFLSPAQQRSLINHYVAATTKIILLFAALYPSVLIVLGRKGLHSYFGNSKVEYGDVLLCVFEVFTSMYIFELFYREKVSYISAAHHIGAIIITQTAIVLFENPKQRQDAELEFILCILWGFFDIAAELWPHVAIIIYRTRPKSHAALADIFLATAILEILGTTTETVTIFTIFFLLWKQWTIEFRVLTPLLHILFSCAQLWGARVFWLMSRQHRKVVEDSDAASCNTAISRRLLDMSTEKSQVRRNSANLRVLHEVKERLRMGQELEILRFESDCTT